MRFLWIPLAVFVLGGIGLILLRTNQAPLPVAVSEGGAPSADADLVNAPAPPPPPVAENPALSTEEFRTLGAEVMRSLPMKNAAKGAEVSFPILVAGERLGAVAEAMQNEPALSEEGLLLFRGCAASDQYSDSVRALCFAYFRAFHKRAEKPISQGMIPAHIRTLAERLAE